MKNYLVTGGAGFIGSHIAKKLVKNGEKVRIFDNFETGKRENIESIKDMVEVFEGDLTNLNDCKKAVDGIDYVFHEGAIPSVPKSVEDPLKSHEANIDGTLNILLAARDAKVKRLVYAASSSAYGNPLGSEASTPKVETMPARPLSPYALQKFVGEEYCKLFFKLYGLETVCIRYFNVFGPFQDPSSPYSGVISLFISALLKDEQPFINGDGETSRDFTFVDNVVHANLLAMKASDKACGETINVAMSQRITLNKLIEVVNKILGKDIKTIYRDERAGDVKHSLADISKAKELLAYEPFVSFEDGLEKTVEYYKGI